MKLMSLDRLLVTGLIVSLGWIPELVGKQVQLEVSMPNPVLLANKKQTTYLKVGMTGFRLANEESRPPVNVAIVLDRSGSMSGEKLDRAKDAAKEAINRLDSQDILSLVVYDSVVNVLVPATKVGDKQLLRERVDQIQSGHSTALFAGVSKGAAELRKFLELERVNRVILLSDGIANQGPSSPRELGELGASLIKEGIAVTTIGLGLDYNEDLMAKLADRSDGNHVFVEHPNQLVAVFNKEFGDILSVVAQEIVVKVKTRPGIRPVRVLGWDAEISGNDVLVSMNQIYSEQEKYVILEVEVPASQANEKLDIATVEIAYTNMSTAANDRLSGKAEVTFTESERMVGQLVNRDVMISCTTQIATANNIAATRLRDEGKIDQARRVLRDNSVYLEEAGKKLQSDFLLEYGFSNRSDAQNLGADNWKRQRKIMRFGQQVNTKQQSVIGPAAPSSLTNQGQTTPSSSSQKGVKTP
jgi:Ca-activated chloride channel family protein